MFLNSSNGVRDSKSHDFTISYIPEIVLDRNKKYYLALDSLDMTYSWFNVSNNYGNNTVKYSKNSGVTWKTITFKNANYSYHNLSEYISQTLEINGDLTDNGKGIKLTFSSSLLKVYIELEENYQIDLTTGDFSSLIGFEKEVVTLSKYGSKQPNITRNVDNIYIHCNLLSESLVSGIESDTLFRFSVNNLQMSYPFEINPRRLLYNRINTNIIKDLRIYVTDGLNNPVDLNDLPIEMTLTLKEV